MNEFDRQSRYESRIKRRRQNRILNILIAVVLVCIVAVGWNLFFGNSETARKPVESSQNPDPAKKSSQEKETIVIKDQDDMKQKETKDKKDSQTPAKEDAIQQKTETQEGMNLEGPWQPVGTKQEGPFQPNFDRGSLNWNEMMRAILLPTGFSNDEIILWWLGNDGGPKKAVGKYSLESEPEKLYIVHIRWIDEKGWKPTAVEVTNENPYE